jgi:serine/threonine-protein kinase
MVQRMPEERRTSMGLGGSPDPADDDGEQVRDEELIGPSDTEHPMPDTSVRFSQPRISQRLPRLVQGPGIPNEGDILVGRYRVERVLARTAHEIVLEASHLDLGQRVLLRHLTMVASTSPEAVARFQRGARKAREMRSEHAERVVDFGRLDSGAPYRAVELPRGPSLAEILRVRGALPIAEAVDIVLTACEPVAEAHASGVVHRSLSTANIFVERRSDGSPLVRVLDFGVSDPLEPDWATGDDLAVPGAGTSVDALRFASPEQIRNPSAVDGRTDVWALGAILYELIAGAPLFQADSSLTLLSMIVADAPTPLALLRADVPPDLEQLVLSCLEKDPDVRPRSVVDVVLALSPHASSEAQPAATRVARIVMRTTRPPALPSQAPSPSSTTARPSSRALVRSSPPPQPIESVAAERPDLRGFGMLFAGAAIGLIAAVVAPRLAPTPAAPAVVVAPAVAPQPVAPPVVATMVAPVQVAPVQAAPLQAAPVQAVSPAPAPVAAVVAAPATVVAAPATVAVAPVAAPVAPTPQPALAAHAAVPAAPVAPAMAAPHPAPRATPDSATAPRPVTTAKSEPVRAPRVAAAPAPAPAKNGASGAKVTASADDLFGGLD